MSLGTGPTCERAIGDQNRGRTNLELIAPARRRVIAKPDTRLIPELR
jgi:hypothetical protein